MKKYQNDHSKDELVLKIEHKPTVTGLPPESKIIFLGKDRVAHGSYYLIVEIKGQKRFFYGSAERLIEEPNAANLNHEQGGRKFYHINGKQFVLFIHEPHRSTITGRDLKVDIVEKNLL